MATAAPVPAPELARVNEVAERLRVCRSTVYVLMDEGKLAFVRLGRARRIPWSAVDKLIAENLHGEA